MHIRLISTWSEKYIELIVKTTETVAKKKFKFSFSQKVNSIKNLVSQASPCCRIQKRSHKYIASFEVHTEMG